MTRKKVIIVNSIALKQKMLEKQKSNKDIAESLGISRSAIQRKLAGETEFDRTEMKKLISVLQLSKDEVMSIFFDM